jgi:U3 small nucleolar ribonucleoprotein protein IMP4
MLRKSVRQRKEYLFKKSLEERESTTFEKKKRLREAIEDNKALPTELRDQNGRNMRRKLDLEDENTKNQGKVDVDDEYAYMGVKDPKVIITTARDPSSRLVSFVKEFRLLIPGAERINRGAYVMKDLVRES